METARICQKAAGYFLAVPKVHKEIKKTREYESPWIYIPANHFCPGLMQMASGSSGWPHPLHIYWHDEMPSTPHESVSLLLPSRAWPIIVISNSSITSGLFISQSWQNDIAVWGHTLMPSSVKSFLESESFSPSTANKDYSERIIGNK